MRSKNEKQKKLKLKLNYKLKDGLLNAKKMHKD